MLDVQEFCMIMLKRWFSKTDIILYSIEKVHSLVVKELLCKVMQVQIPLQPLLMLGMAPDIYCSVATAKILKTGDRHLRILAIRGSHRNREF